MTTTKPSRRKTLKINNERKSLLVGRLTGLGGVSFGGKVLTLPFKVNFIGIFDYFQTNIFYFEEEWKRAFMSHKRLLL